MSLLLRSFHKNLTTAIYRNFHASSITNDSFKRFDFNTSGYNKYGLLKDDLLPEVNPDVKEAVRRLPEEEKMQRIYRAIRAQQAYINHVYLPKEEWTKFEDNHDYLQPYLQEIQKEKQEREDWEASH